jgi:hypothetical protein
MAEFDPSTAKVGEVLSKLEKADEQERTRILNAERAGQARKTILEAYGIDPDERADAEGRVLYPWEVSPEDSVLRVPVEEDDEARAAREAQAEYDAQVAAARPQVDEQGGGTPLGAADTGTAPGAGAVPTSGNTSMGAPGT